MSNIEDVKIEEFDDNSRGGGESSRKESMTRYESDWKMVNDYLQELQ